LVNTAIIGASLGVTGSNSMQLVAGIPSDWGSMFVGRNNAQDGGRAESAKNVFVVGTGIASNRKTGFLIDSGSNSFFEGTLNVSGATSLNGTTNITGSLLVNGVAVVGVNTASFATTGSNSFNGNQTITGTLNVIGNSSFNGSQTITGSLIISGSGAQARFPSFDATQGRIKETLSFTGSRFTTDLSMSIEMENLNGTEFGFNQLDLSDANTGAQFILNTNKASTFTELKLNARYTGSSNAEIRIRNTAGVRTATVDADTSTFNGAVNITQTMKLSSLDPLPTAVNGTMAVSGSNLYFASGSNWFAVSLI